jgi:hypothetical protein
MAEAQNVIESVPGTEYLVDGEFRECLASCSQFTNT